MLSEHWGSPDSSGHLFAGILLQRAQRPGKLGNAGLFLASYILKCSKLMSPRGGAESIQLACSPAGHLFVNLIKEKWLLLSSSCSLSAKEPILYGGHGSADSLPLRGCRQSAGMS